MNHYYTCSSMTDGYIFFFSNLSCLLTGEGRPVRPHIFFFHKKTVSPPWCMCRQLLWYWRQTTKPAYCTRTRRQKKPVAARALIYLLLAFIVLLSNQVIVTTGSIGIYNNRLLHTRLSSMTDATRSAAVQYLLRVVRTSRRRNTL